MEPLLHSGLEGETLRRDGCVRRRRTLRILSALNAARVVFEVGHTLHGSRKSSAGVDTKCCGQPAINEGSKRRKRKNDRIDANKLARLGRVDPKSCTDAAPQSEVRQDLVVLRARDTLVAPDGADQRHARTGEDYGLTASQMFEPELRTKAEEKFPSSFATHYCRGAHAAALVIAFRRPTPN